MNDAASHAPLAAPSRWIARFAPLIPPGARVLDLACGLIEKHIRTTVEQAASEVPGLTLNTVRVAKRRKA